MRKTETDAFRVHRLILARPRYFALRGKWNDQAANSIGNDVAANNYSSVLMLIFRQGKKYNFDN